MPSPLRVTLRAALVELLTAIDNLPETPLQTPSDLSSTERRILDAATFLPTPGKVLIRKAGLDINSTTRNAITKLVRLGHLVRTADGYTRAIS